MRTASAPVQRREEGWRAAFTRFEGSGQTVSDFCRRERLSEPSFYYWRRRLRAVGTPQSRELPPAGFVDLGLMSDQPRPIQGHLVEIQLDLGGGIILHIRRG